MNHKTFNIISWLLAILVGVVVWLLVYFWMKVIFAFLNANLHP